METKSDQTSSQLLTEEVYCPHHATTYNEAYESNKVYYAHHLRTYPPPLAEREDFWLERAKNPRYLSSRCHSCNCAHTTFCLEQAHLARTKRIETEQKQAGATKHAELGPREFTFTYATEWYESDEDAQNAMRCAIERLTRYYSQEIIEFHAVGEFTRAGASHVHGWYYLAGGRKITDKNFKRAWKHWNPKRKLGRGFEGGHHETIQRLSDFSGYTEKHLEEAWLDIHITNGNPEVIEYEEASTPPS